MRFDSPFMISLFVVPDMEPSAGMQASVVPQNDVSGDSDVFICEEARDTLACESDAVSVLAVEAAHSSRTQHSRDAVGLEPSVVYNDWDKDIVAIVVVFLMNALFGVCYFLLSCLLLGLVGDKFIIVLFSWIEGCFSWVAHDDVCCPVCDVRPERCPS